MANDGKKNGAARLSTPGVIAQADERVATELSREAYSRERYEFLLRIIFTTFGFLAVSLALNIWLATRETKFRYFATDPEGGISEVVPLERPIQSIGEVLNWSTEVITKAFTLSFANYQQQIDESRLNFTDTGWIGFQDALKRNKLLDTLVEQQYVTSATPKGAPVVISQGLVEGNRYGWKIQIPILLTWESASLKNSTDLIIEAVIVRRDPTENPRGLGVAQIVAK